MRRALLDVNVLIALLDEAHLQLALAARQGGRFVTFDQRIVPQAVIDATGDHLAILSHLAGSSDQ